MLKTSTKNKVICIGLDGISRDTLMHFASTHLRTINTILKQKHVLGTMPILPPLTPPAWTTITSGVNPGKHGIFDFRKLGPMGEDRGINTSLDVMHERVHDIVSFSKNKSLIANLPLSSFPMRPEKAYVFSDIMSPKEFAFPSLFGQIFSKNLKEYRSKYIDDKGEQNSICTAIARDYAILKTLLTKEAKKVLMNEVIYTFIMIDVFDALTHLDPKSLNGKPRHKCISDTLILLDELIGFILENINENDTFIILSDHGGGEAYYRINLARFFYDSGLIVPKVTSLRNIGNLPKERQAERNGINNVALMLLNNMLENLVYKNKILARMFVKIGRKILALEPKLRSKLFDTVRPVPDPYKSAVNLVTYGIYLNNNLTVQSPEQLIDNINSLQETLGHKFIYNIEIGRGRYYQGPYQYRAPHIVYSNAPGYDMSNFNVHAPLLEKAPGNYGVHYPHNVHVVISNNSEILDLSRYIEKPWDYAAIMLLALGLPLPQDTDSRLCEKAGIKCAYKNYTPVYLLRRKIFAGKKSSIGQK